MKAVPTVLSAISLQIRSDADVRKNSVVRIEANATSDGINVKGTLSDPRMGPNFNVNRCGTCGNKADSCPTHGAYIELKYPIVDPKRQFFSDMQKWLTAVCWICGEPIKDPSSCCNLSAVPDPSKLAVYVESLEQNKTTREKALKKVKEEPHRWVLSHCGEQHPFISVNDHNKRLLEVTWITDNPADRGVPLQAQQMYEVLCKVRPATVALFGRDPATFHPKDLVHFCIPVLPVNLRSSNLIMPNGQAKMDQRSAIYSKLAAAGNFDSLKVGTHETLENFLMHKMYLGTREETHKKILVPREQLIREYTALQTGKQIISKDKSVMTKTDSINDELKGKVGLFRNAAAARAHNRGRMVIANCTEVMPDEVVLPLFAVLRLYHDVIVTEWNYDKMYRFFINGTSQYPRCLQITKGGSGDVYIIETIDPATFRLEYGDTMKCNLEKDGDVLLNRQPSLTLANIGRHDAQVHPSLDYYCAGFNIEACQNYNADFDGDQMTILLPIGTRAKVESRILSSMDRWFIADTNASPRWGLSQDSRTLIAELTRSRVRVSRLQAQFIFAKVRGNFIFDRAKEWYTGRELVTMILPNFDYERQTSLANSQIADLLGLEQDERVVRIVDGVMLSGVLDNASIGQVSNSLFHRIYFEFGIREMMLVLFNLQQMALAFGRIWSFSLGIKDFHVSLMPSKIKIMEEINKVRMESDAITEKLYNKTIIPPGNTTVEEHFENCISNVSRIEPMRAILDAIGLESALLKMITYGSRGKLEHIIQICAAAQQITINGRRPPQVFDYRRSSVLFPRFDQSAVSRGLVTSSYDNGLMPSEYLDAARGARSDITKKALATSEAGTCARMLVRNAESLIISYFSTIVRNNTVISWIFGDNNYDATKIFKVKLLTVEPSTAWFEEQYRPTDAALQEPLIAAAWKQLVADRETFRGHIMKYEVLMSKAGIMTDRIYTPIDIAVQVKRQVRHVARQTPATPREVAEMLKIVAGLLEDIPYASFNSNARALIRSIRLPAHFYESYSFFLMYVRSCLHPRALTGLTVATVAALRDLIWISFRSALIQPNEAIGIISAVAISEPITQKQLDSHHAIGADRTSNSFGDIENLLYARETIGTPQAMMHIRLLPHLEQDKLAAEHIVTEIQTLRLRDLVQEIQVFYESYGEPRHPRYAAEKVIYQEYARYHRYQPTNISNYCIRLRLSRYQMILKSIDSADLINRLLLAWGGSVHIVYSNENHEMGMVLRIHILKSEHKHYSDMDKLLAYKDKIVDTIVRGISGIEDASVVKMNKTFVDDAGALSKKEIYTIVTRGTNLLELLSVGGIDFDTVQTTSVHETLRTFGMAAARDKIVTQWIKILDDINPAFLILFADDMTSTTTITPLNRVGNRKRENNNILLNSCTANAIDVMSNGALNSIENKLYGLSANLMFAQPVGMGTGRVVVVPNKKFLMENKPYRQKQSTAEMIEAF